MRKEPSLEPTLRHITFYFLDNSTIKLAWPKQGSKDAPGASPPR